MQILKKPINYHKKFLKAYLKLIKASPKLKETIKLRLNLFMEDKSNFLLKDHALIGEMKDLRSFSVTGDIRIIYVEYQDLIVLVDIGTHNQVY
jgi:addiction module RelE/StbE family toxin